jgi:hypothetical protein
MGLHGAAKVGGGGEKGRCLEGQLAKRGLKNNSRDKVAERPAGVGTSGSLGLVECGHKAAMPCLELGAEGPVAGEERWTKGRKVGNAVPRVFREKVGGRLVTLLTS